MYYDVPVGKLVRY